MIDATPEYLLNVVDEKTTYRIWESMEGMRVYFPKHVVRDNFIIRDYNEMTNTRIEAIKELSYKYEISTAQIRRIITKGIRKAF